MLTIDTDLKSPTRPFTAAAAASKQMNTEPAEQPPKMMINPSDLLSLKQSDLRELKAINRPSTIITKL